MTDTLLQSDGIPGNYEGHRFDFVGGWKNDKRNTFVNTERTATEKEVFNYLKTLLNYRKKTTALQTGKMMQFLPENGIYVFFRYDKNSTVMIVCNNNEQSTTVSTNRFKEMIKGKKTALEITTGQTINIEKEITVPAKTIFVLELKNGIANLR